MYHVCFSPQFLPLHRVKEQMNWGKYDSGCVCLFHARHPPTISRALDQLISVLIFGVRGHTHTLIMKSQSLHIMAITERYKPINLFLWAQTHTKTCTGLSLHAVKLFQLYYPSDVLLSVVYSKAWGGGDR